ncbi:nuclear transport factor 2 family protein [Niallia taxi]|uniref:nuclear transport factor 2 family protein n=1 Tax=Niallia taxi TaxID=2499688 RepID=UPI00203BE931|nr:nuclear transport factor 2 family protein [Niallia taxi]MCM3217721.1 nuclear transport factor 2 family protein [Niallia taxi]
MIDETIKGIIIKYVEAYNSFDIEGMIKLLHNDILFRNISKGEIDTETKGIQEFRDLAEMSSKIFTSRLQTITDFVEIGDLIEVRIEYEGTLADDLPNGLKKDDKIQLKGKSQFGFKEGKISQIEDYS